MRALFECNSTSLRALGISINFISERSSAWQFLWYFPLLTKKVHTKKFYMILFSLQKSIQKASNLIFRFYFANCNQKLCNSAFSLKQTKLKNRFNKQNYETPYMVAESQLIQKTI